MRIRDLSVDNFRVVQHLALDHLPRICGIWGRNGSGKSALLQAVVVLRNFAENMGWGGGHVPQFNSRGLTLGGPEQVHWKGGAGGAALRIEITEDERRRASVTFSRMGQGPQVVIQGPDLTKIRYFPAQRNLVNRVSNVQSFPRVDLGPNTASVHPFVHWFLHEKIRERQRSGKPNEIDRIDDWMTKVGFGPISDHLDQAFGSGQVTAVFRDPATDYDTAFIDGGFGGVSFAPIVLEGYSFTDGVLLIEEPESSLHPGAQAEVFDFLVEMATQRNHQILFSSHSMYLLGRFARYARDHADADELLGVYAATKDAEGAHFGRIPLPDIVSRAEKDQNLLSDLYLRWPS